MQTHVLIIIATFMTYMMLLGTRKAIQLVVCCIYSKNNFHIVENLAFEMIRISDRTTTNGSEGDTEEAFCRRKMFYRNI